MIKLVPSFRGNVELLLINKFEINQTVFKKYDILHSFDSFMTWHIEKIKPWFMVLIEIP